MLVTQDDQERCLRPSLGLSLVDQLKDAQSKSCWNLKQNNSLHLLTPARKNGKNKTQKEYPPLCFQGGSVLFHPKFPPALVAGPSSDACRV